MKGKKEKEERHRMVALGVLLSLQRFGAEVEILAVVFT